MRRPTWADCLAIEAATDQRHEFHDGEIVALAGGTARHAYLTLAAGSELRALVRGRDCRTFSPDLKVWVAATSRAFYPDVTLICGAPEHPDGDPTVVTNPSLVVEVLSPSTHAIDRGEKFLHYQQIPSLRTYVLVASDPDRLEVFTRDGDGWFLRVWRLDEVAELPALGVSIPVRAVFDGAPAPMDADRSPPPPDDTPRR